MTWNTCQFPECESWTRRADGDYCGTHERTIAKQETESKKQLEKRNSLLQKAKEKNMEPRKMPKKVSPKREELNKEYFILVEQFKKDNPECRGRINEYCTEKTDDVHHSRGRGKYLLDVSTFIPLCRSCHNFVTDHPADAMKRGLSFSRLTTTEPNKI